MKKVKGLRIKPKSLFVNNMREFIADKNRKLSKLALYHIEDLSFSGFMKALRKKDVKVNGKRVSEDITLSIGDKVEIFYVPTEKEKYKILYKDQNVLVINKISGYTSESVYEEIKKECTDAGFIHRLDRNTSGVMIFSLNQSSEGELLKGFKERIFDKKYTTTVVGKMPKKEDVLCAYLVKDKENARVKIFDKKVQNSVLIKTGYKVLEETKDLSKLEITLYTGKTHQIRAHLAHIGNPILGDGKYGNFEINKKYNLLEQQLSATSLTLFFEQKSLLYYLNGKNFSIKG